MDEHYCDNYGKIFKIIYSAITTKGPVICYDTITIVLCTTGNANDWLSKAQEEINTTKYMPQCEKAIEISPPTKNKAFDLLM